MENFLRRYGWVITLGLIGVGALLVALTANNILASKLAPYTVPELPELVKAPAAPAAGVSNASGWRQAISPLCLFGCVEDEPLLDECPEGCEDGERCEAGECVPLEEGEEGELSDVPVLSDLSVEFLGAMVAHTPEHSMALIRDGSNDATLILGVGDFIGEEAEIIEIRRDRVFLRRGAQLEYLQLDKMLGDGPTRASAGQKTAAASAKAPARAPAAEPTETRSSDLKESVKSLGQDRYEVQRQAIEKELKTPRSVAAQGRVVPNEKNGVRDGLKVVGISPNSVYTQLGIQSGDVLQSVNGQQINSSQQAMDLFKQLQSEGDVTVEIERSGQKKKMQYHVR